MDNEPYRELTHTQALEFLASYYRDHHHRVATEVTLPNRRRADILMVTPSGYYEIIEVKTNFSSTITRAALTKYRPWCNYLYVAVTGLQESHVRQAEAIPRWRHHFDGVGLIGVYPCSMVRHRVAQAQNLPPKICDILADILDRHPGR
jgi:hypothetical protein